MDSKPQITTSAKLEGTEEGEDGSVRKKEREKTQEGGYVGERMEC